MLHGNEQISELQKYMASIYGDANSELTVESILGRIIEAISDTTAPFEMVDVSSTSVKALSWYFAFCNRIPIDVQSSVVRRYPQLCPLCLSEICICERTNRLPRRATHLSGNRDETLNIRAERLLNSTKYTPRKTPSFDLNWLSHTLADIYPSNRARWKVNRFFFPSKMLRELGKLANGFRRLRNAGNSSIAPSAKVILEHDAADFLAWLIGYWTLASDVQGVDLQEKFVRTYKVGCPYCDQLPCACPRERRLGNRAEFVSFNLLNRSPDLARELDRRLSEIKDSLVEYPDLHKELDAEIKRKPTDPRNVLMRIASKMRTIDDATGSAERVVRRVSSAIEWIDRTIAFFQN